MVAMLESDRHHVLARYRDKAAAAERARTAAKAKHKPREADMFQRAAMFWRVAGYAPVTAPEREDGDPAHLASRFLVEATGEPAAVYGEPWGDYHRTALMDALNVLTLKQLPVALLRHVAGWDVSEIAHELGMKDGAVEAHLLAVRDEWDRLRRGEAPELKERDEVSARIRMQSKQAAPAVVDALASGPLTPEGVAALLGVEYIVASEALQRLRTAGRVVPAGPLTAKGHVTRKTVWALVGDGSEGGVAEWQTDRRPESRDSSLSTCRAMSAPNTARKWQRGTCRRRVLRKRSN